MSVSASEVQASYLDSLDELKDAATPVIANLTELAYEYAGSHPKVIVDVIEERLKKGNNVILTVIKQIG